MKKIVFLFLLILPLNLFAQEMFNGENALLWVKRQVDLGPRYLSSDGHQRLKALIAAEGKKYGKLTGQTFVHRPKGAGSYRLTNIMIRMGEQKKRILIGSHFDTRRFADKDTADPTAPVLGANDGASGVAVMLELARVLATKKLNIGVDLVFFDGEEGIPNHEWYPIGSLYFAQNLAKFYGNNKPELAIVVDMVCDRDLQLKIEQSSLQSAKTQVQKLWKIGAKHSKAFESNKGYRIYDDHTALQKQGIPAILIIDFDYPVFHTTKDDLSQCSSESLRVVGQTLVDTLVAY